MAEQKKLHLIEPEHTKIQRYVCRAEAPWSPEKGRYAIHPDARPLSTPVKGAVKLGCPHCRRAFSLVAI